MKANTYINANDFIETLKNNGLIIVSAAEYEATKDLQSRKMMKRKAISLKEIVEHRLLPLKTKKGVQDWIDNQKIKPVEWYTEKGSQNKIMVLTAAIRRLGYGE